MFWFSVLIQCSWLSSESYSFDSVVPKFVWLLPYYWQFQSLINISDYTLHCITLSCRYDLALLQHQVLQRDWHIFDKDLTYHILGNTRYIHPWINTNQAVFLKSSKTAKINSVHHISKSNTNQLKKIVQISSTDNQPLPLTRMPAGSVDCREPAWLVSLMQQPIENVILPFKPSC